jgi:hypothetical protein
MAVGKTTYKRLKFKIQISNEIWGSGDASISGNPPR